jgi:NADH-quinone oxidoreductase subunit L
VSIAVVGIGIAAFLWFRREELGPFRGLTQRNAFARRGYTFLENKYYLDHLYENVIVDGTRGAIARAFYWFDQHVIDGVVNGVGRIAARIGRYTYDVLDQRVVDGSINAVAAGTGDAGSAVQTVQSGRVQRYALLLFASVGVMALIVFLVNAI